MLFLKAFNIYVVEISVIGYKVSKTYKMSQVNFCQLLTYLLSVVKKDKHTWLILKVFYVAQYIFFNGNSVPTYT